MSMNFFNEHQRRHKIQTFLLSLSPRKTKNLEMTSNHLNLSISMSQRPIYDQFKNNKTIYLRKSQQPQTLQMQRKGIKRCYLKFNPVHSQTKKIENTIKPQRKIKYEISDTSLINKYPSNSITTVRPFSVYQKQTYRNSFFRNTTPTRPLTAEQIDERQRGRIESLISKLDLTPMFHDIQQILSETRRIYRRRYIQEVHFES